MKPSITDVAALARVSPSTVSNYFHKAHVVSPQTQERIRAAVETLRYVPNGTARQLRSGQSRTIALMLLDAWTPFYAELSRGVEDVAYGNDWNVLFSNSARNSERERQNLEMFESHGVQGVLVVPHGDIDNQLYDLRRRGTACVTLEQIRPPKDISAVEVDDHKGGALAARHLMASGKKRLAFIGDPTTVGHVNERWQGFHMALDDSEGTTTMTVRTDDLTLRDGLKAAEDLLRLAEHERPDGIFAANDLLAIGLLHAYLRAGIRIPDDVLLVGYDDIEFASQATVPLTTIRQPAYELGKAAAEILIQEMTSKEVRPPQHVLLAPELIVRDSAP